MLSLADLAALHAHYQHAFEAPVTEFSLGPHRFEGNPCLTARPIERK